VNTPYDGAPSLGERLLQQELGTTERANSFYDRQVSRELTSAMHEFIARQPMVFLSTADAGGHCDTSFRAGPPGFVEILDDRTLTYPEYRGNGVMASAGNITENPHIGLLFMDFTQDHIGLHVNGTAQLRADSEQRSRHPWISASGAAGRTPLMWVHITVHEAYVHCSKHIPHLQEAPREHNTARNRPKDALYFTTPHLQQSAGMPEPPEHGAAQQHQQEISE
jgi:uncharacterized protein